MIYYKKKSWFKKIYYRIIRSNFSITPVFGLVKLLKSAISLLFFLIAALYLSYLFLLPKFLDEKIVEDSINNYLNKNTKLTLDLDELKIKPDYKLNIKLQANSIKLYYPNKTVFVSIKNPDIDINLVTLFFNYIDLNRIKADKIIINTDFTKAKKYSCLEYFNLDIFDLKKHNLKFQLRNINIIAKELEFNLYDKNINKYFYLVSNNIKLSMGDNKKPLQLKTKGLIKTKNHRICDYDLNLEYLLQKNVIDNFKSKIEELNYNPLVYMDKYKFYSNTTVKLKITQQTKKTDITGSILLNDYTFCVNGINLAKNKLLINFKGDRISADCNFNLINNQFIKASVVGRLSKNKFIELKINSNDINLSELKIIIEHLVKIVNPKINTDNFTLSGKTKLNVYLKSDYKTITSNGSLLIENAKLTDKTQGLKLDNINSNINFKDNKINILSTSALVDKSKFYLTGSIDSNTNLNLKVDSELIDIIQIINLIKTLPFAYKYNTLLKQYSFKKGCLKTTASIKGNLKNPIITTNTTIKDLQVIINDIKGIISTKEILVNSDSNNNIIVNAKNTTITNQNNKAYIEESRLKVDKNKIKLLDANILFDKNKLSAKGEIDLSNESGLLYIEGKIANNYIKNKNLLLKSKIHLTKTKLDLIDTALFQGDEKLALISGSVDNFDSFNNLKIIILDKINLIYKDISLETKGTLTLQGKIKNPSINGSLNLDNIIKKDIELYIKEATLNLKNSYGLVELKKAKLSNVDFDLTASGKYSNNKLVIEFLNFFCDYINLNNIKKINAKNSIDIEINNLKGSIGVVDYLNSQLDSINFEGKFNNSILTIDKFSAQGFKGKIEGGFNYNTKNSKTKANLVLKELNIRYLSREIKELSIAQSGRLSALIDAEFIGYNLDDIKKTIKAYVKFNINDGELTQFAKLERFLQAGNILSQSILKLSLNSSLSAISKQNTGYFKTIEGTVKIQNSIANIQYIKSIGPNMSLYLTGKFNILNYNCSAEVLGRIPSSIVSVMGNIGKFSTSQLVDKMSDDTKNIIKAITTSPIEKMLSAQVAKQKTDKIPPLYNEAYKSTTREFIVEIIGPIESLSSIRNFKWIVY